VSALELLVHATSLSLGLLLLAMGICVVRLMLGPTLADRILALDTLTTVMIGFIGTFAIRSGLMLYLDIAIALGLAAFLATIALARYLLSRHPLSRDEDILPEGVE